MANVRDVKWCMPEWGRIGLGVGIGFAVMLVLTALGAMLFGGEILDWCWANYVAAFILLLSSFAGGLAAGGRGEVMDVIVFAGVYWLVLLLVHGAVYGGAISGGLETILLVLGGSGAPLLLRGNKRKKPAFRRRKYGNW